jgi:CHAT domain-containing protein
MHRIRSGRLGRLRWLGWSLAFSLALMASPAKSDYGTDQTEYAATGRYDLIEKQVEALLQKGPIRTRDQHALCFAYSKLKRYDRLLTCLDQLQVLVEKGDKRTRIFGLDDATPVVLLMRAEAMIDLGQTEAARTNAVKALEWLKADGASDQDLVVGSYAALVQAAVLDGDKALAQQTLEILKDYRVGGDYRRAKAMAVARAQTSIGAWADVIATLESSEAQFRFDKLLDQYLSGAIFTGKNNWLWVELPRAFMLAYSQLQVGQVAEAKLGFDRLIAIPALAVNAEIHWQTLVARGQIAEKENRFEDALRYFRRAREIIETQRRSVRSELSKIGFSSNKQSAYQGIIRVALKNGNKALAIEIAEQAKARSLIDVLSAKASFAPPGARADETQSAFEAFDRADKELGIQLPDASASSRLELIAERAAALQRLRRASPQLASLVSADEFKLSDALRKLTPKEVLLGFFTSGQSRYVYAASGTSIEVKPVLLAEGDAQFVEFIQAVKKRRKSVTELSPQLYTQLIKPIEASIRGKDLLIIPYGELHYMPFAALNDGQAYLMQGRAIRYLPSALMLALAKPATSTSTDIKRMLILGNPDLGKSELDLPSAQEEAQSLQGMFKDNSELFIRKAATESLLKDRIKEFSHIHVASHGEFFSANPLASRLRLSKDSRNDGELTVSEVYEMSINADLVMLSACETGLGKVSNGDDVIGLMRGFLYSGAKAVIGTLWEVDDEATADLSKRFYSNLRKGWSNAKALAEAQEFVAGKKPHPFYWAAFAMSGG